MIYFCSFPKSGRTWLRYMLAKYFKLLWNIDLDTGFHTLGKVFFDTDELPRSAVYDDFPEFMFSHTSYHELPRDIEDSKVVLLLRGVCDTMVSYYFHLYIYKDPKPLMSDAIQPMLSGWCQYLNEWVGNKDRVCIVTYETLNQAQTIRKILKYCEYEAVEELIKEAQDQSDFKTMQQDEIVHPMDPKRNKGRPEDRRIRRGVVDGYRDYLSQKEIDSVRDCCYNELRPETKQWLEGFDVLRF